jgi:hypothetical protein
MTVNGKSFATSAWRIERSGEFGDYVVSGWRYTDLTIWHVNVWQKSDQRPAQTYVVAAGEFYPEPVTPGEKFGVFGLIAAWEAAEPKNP